MCLTLKSVKQGIIIEPKIAKEDIKVFKVLIRLGSNPFICIYRSPVYRHLYQTGCKYEVEGIEIRYAMDWNNCSLYVPYVEKGLHSYSTLKAAKKSGWAAANVVVEMIIPKGSKYIKGGAEIVSSRIKWPKGAKTHYI